MMNERAAALGCTNTHFVNANGLPDPNHYTSAHDMALIMQECIKNETFCRIESDLTYTIQPTNMTSTPRDLQNHHALLFQDGQWGYKGAFAGKTGYTDEAHNTLVTAAKRGNMTLVCVVLTCDNLDYINDTRTVLDFGYDNFTHYTLKNAKKESLSGVVTLPKNAKIETATYTDPDGASVEEPYTRQYLITSSEQPRFPLQVLFPTVLRFPPIHQKKPTAQIFQHRKKPRKFLFSPHCSIFCLA